MREKNLPEKYHHVESFHGTFSLSFALPDNVKLEAIRCEYKDGVLIVHLPKKLSEKSKPVRITVEQSRAGGRFARCRPFFSAH